ncbi:unnamed protein product [Euphydryas editha]|uniref:Uncharacterized protein n=1 Tax=Euphydryas editha TaxID=104508 RepID=A0AAU9TWN4_EUPED|nr:unnamed protein product [Euphydryas editha]
MTIRKCSKDYLVQENKDHLTKNHSRLEIVVLVCSAPATDTENEGSKVNSRPRPRKRQHDDELTVFMTQMKKSIETFDSTARYLA